MDNTNIKEIVDTTLNNLSKAAEVNTIVGKPLVTLDGTTVLPISQITLGFVSGGGEYPLGGKTMFKETKLSNFAGASGGGATLSPVGFLIVDKNGVKFLNTVEQSNLSKLTEVAVDLIKPSRKA